MMEISMETAIAGFERYLRARYPNSSTAKHYVHDVQQLQQQITKAPRAITPTDITEFVEAQLAQGLAARTVNRRLSALHEFFEWLAREHDPEDWGNPVQWRQHHVKEGKTLPRDASEADLARLFAQISAPRDVALFRLMLDAGLRVGEVAGLQVTDLTLDAAGESGRLRVLGKGSQERFVWVLGETLTAVQTWLAERPASAEPALFLTRRRRAFSVRGIQERLQHYCQLAGVQISPHQLRHSFGRRMAEAEMPVTSLAELLGHAQVTTTQIYISGAALEVRADYQAAIERLPAARASVELPDTAPATRDEDVWTLADVSPAAVTPPPAPPAVDAAPYWEGLPAWLTAQLTAYLRACQSRWQANYVVHHTRTRARTLRQLWRGLLADAAFPELSAVRQHHVQAYVEARLAAGRSAATVNRELSELWAFLRYAEAHGVPLSPGVFRVARPKEGARLPRFLSDSDYQRLVAHVQQQTATGTRDACLDRLWFYLLSDAGLRLGEVCALQLGDIDLPSARLLVRAGKNMRDRSVPLASRVLQALRAYLPQRGMSTLPHLLLFQGQPLHPTLIQNRLQRYGAQVNVAVSPHRLRHTLATRLLNAGMPITSLQQVLGHEQISTTMIYAHVHNQTVQRDFERAFARLHPTDTLADALFNTPTHVSVIQSVVSEDNCV